VSSSLFLRYFRTKRPPNGCATVRLLHHYGVLVGESMMDNTDATLPPAPAPKVFVIRVTERKPGHKLLGYAFVQQTAFFPAHDDNALPEVKIVLNGLEQLFDKSGEYAFAAVPFEAANDPTTGSMMLGANVHGANVDPGPV
jgi:hypothetical protein